MPVTEFDYTIDDVVHAIGLLEKKIDYLIESKSQPSSTIDIKNHEPITANRFLSRAQIISKINRGQKSKLPVVLPVEES